MAAPTGPMIVSMRLAIDTSELSKIVGARGDVKAFGEAAASAGAQAQVLSAAIEDQLAAVSASASGTDALTAALDAARAATLSAAQASQASAQAASTQTSAITALTGALQASVRTEGARAAAASQAAADIVAARKAEAQAAAEARRAAVEEATARAAADRAAADRATTLAATQARVAADQARAYQQRVAQWEAERSAARAAAAASEQAAQAETARVTAVRDAYVPLHAETRIYRESLREIRAAEARGDLTSRQATAAIRAEKDAYADLVRVQRASGMTGQGGPVRWSTLEGWRKRQLIPQVWDAFTSLGSGMNAGVVAIQQGPQAIEAVGGMKAAMALVTSAITPVTVAVAAAAAAVVVGGAAWNSYLASTKEVATAAHGLGRNIGATVDELEQIAQASAGSAGVSVRSARSMEAAFLRTGKIGVEQYRGLIGIAKDFGATIGADADTAAEKLADLFRDPSRGAQTLSQDMGLLDGVTARYAQRLAAAGREEDARSALLAALPARLASAAEATTGWSRAWDRVATSAGNAWDAIGKLIDRATGMAPVTIDVQIDAIDRRLADLRAGASPMDSALAAAGIDPLSVPQIDTVRQAEIDRLEAERRRRAQEREDQAAEATAARVRAQSDAAVGRAYGIAQGSAGASSEQTRRRLEQEIATLQGGLAAGALGDERSDITATLQAKTRALKGLETQQARNAELDRLDVQIQTERNPLIRAGLVARQAELRIGAEEVTDKEAATRIEQARTKAYAEARAEMAATSRERATAAAEEIAAIDRQTAAIGQSAGAIAAAEAAARALADAKREAGSAGVIDPAEIERIRQYAADVQAATDRQVAARLADDLAFEQSQIGRGSVDQAVASRLRSAGIDPSSAAGQAAADRIRTMESARASRERATAAAEETAAIDRQTAAIDATAGAIARADAAARMLAEAKERAGSYEAISPGERAEIERYADAIGAATDRLAAARLQGDLAFERAQLDRSPTEQRVAETLRSSGVDPSSAAGQEAASRIREIEGIQAQREALGELRDDLSDYLDKVRESGDAWAAAGDLADATLNRILKALQNEVLNQVLGLPSAATGGGILGLLGLGGQTAAPEGVAAVTRAATAAPLMLLPAAQAAQVASAASPTPAASATPVAAATPAVVARWAPQVTAEAMRAGVDPALALAVLRAESGGNPGARSGAGAIGLMQLMPGTANDLGVDPYDPADNIRGGVNYLAMLQQRYGGDQRRMLAAYNWGMGRVDRWSGDMGTLPGETRAYIGRIEGYMGAGNASPAAEAVERLATSADTAATSTAQLSAGFTGLGQSTQGLFASLGSGLDRLLGGGLGGATSWFSGLLSAGSAAATSAALPVIGGLYDRGGWTGAGGLNEPAGIVHRGEIVWSQRDIARAGGPTVVEGMRTGLRGYADGGVVGSGVIRPAAVITELAGQMAALRRLLSGGASGPVPAMAGTGGGDLRPEVVLEDRAGVRVTRKEERSSTGRLRTRLVVDRAVAEAVSDPRSDALRAISQSAQVRDR